jgi:indole-3-glycerol phosphate synthase
MSILDEIFASKRHEVAERQAREPLAALQARAAQAPMARDFAAALRAAPRAPALIAEIKRASPSRGLLVPNFDPCRLAELYTANGAAAISVLTDESYFMGSLEHLRAVAALPGRPPLLRKDFLCDPYQVYEARAAGADAVLLIVAGLAPSLLSELHALARSLGLTPLVEVHSASELDVALRCDPIMVGINNRDLRDFTVSLDTTLRLRPAVPPRVLVVAESGIHTAADVQSLAEVGVDAILVGESLVTAPDIAVQVRLLSGQAVTDAA